MASISTIWNSFSESFPELIHLVLGLGYLMGIGMIIHALTLFYDLGGRQTAQNVPGHFYGAWSFLFSGAALLWLPSMLSAMEVTLFGNDSPLAYENADLSTELGEYLDVNDVMPNFFMLVGVIWFVRGWSLIASSGDPGVQHGKRGVIMLIASLFAINFEDTLTLVKATIQSIISGGLTLYPLIQTTS